MSYIPPYFSLEFYGSGFRSHPRPAIFSYTKQLVLLLDTANWCVLPYCFNVLNRLVIQSFTICCMLLLFSLFPTVANEPEVSPICLFLR
ncbi:Dedicator of cytokinesis protein 5 [Labeo rohita]|uniref:Dedicator of cytokinesis protein 5 n=1 Tax=Labeo rohita TaxID=84645 RepID=A0ABQ8LRY6_LABRO|nr:Dedicator of cytokinesis protein 5 [Labeo rohita]